MRPRLADELIRLRPLFPQREPAQRTEAPQSAVLAPVVSHPSGLCLLFTRRTEKLSQHPGEISFPGGRIEANDRSPLDAALRETREEIGIAADQIDVYGHLVDFLTFRSAYVAAYVGAVNTNALLHPIQRNAEVAEAFLIPVESLLRPAPRARAAVPVANDPIRLLLVRAEKFEARRFEGLPESERTILYWKLSNGRTLWGITAQLVASFLERCYGWKPPGPPTPVSDIEDILP